MMIMSLRLVKQNKLLLTILFGLIALSSALTFHHLAHAQTFNQQINYQGKLTDNTGATVADGVYNIAFNLYDSTETTILWTSTTTATTTNGLFSYMLGSSSTLSGVDFNQTLYLSVNIGGTGAPSWDGEMTPRKILGAVPAAFEADNAQTLDNLATSSFLRSDQADTADNLITFAAGASSTDLVVSGTATTTELIVNGTASSTNVIISNNVTLSAHTSGILTTNNTGVVSASTSLSDSFIEDDLTLGSGATFANNIITTDAVLSTGQTDEYCLTYETGDTWEWQDCSTGIGADTLDWDDFTDTMTLDATTTIAMAHALNFDSGTFYIDGQNDRVGVGTSTPESTFDLWGSGTDDIFRISSSSGSRLLTIDKSGNIGIGTTTPYQELSISGDLALTGALYDSSASAGTNGYVLQTDGSSVSWVATSSLGISGGTSLFTDGGDTTYLTSLTDSLLIGSSTLPDNATNTRLYVYGGRILSTPGNPIEVGCNL